MFDYPDHVETIDAKLAKAFAGITWIGELPVTERDFKILASSVKMYSRVEQIPPRILMVSMVFCARYAIFGEDENINFWSKYFERVLRKTKTQMLENEYRKAFRNAREKLQAEYHFEFPTRDQTPQEVVSGIYLHAILPAYLQDDFAQFFVKHYPNPTSWQEVDKLFVDQIAAQNEGAFFTPPTLKRLIRFLQHKDTSITAARLIKTLATAALWQSEGQNIDDIASVLAPIEQAIWKQMVPLLPKVDAIPEPRPPSTRIRWAWLIEQNDILELHINNLPVEGETPPDRLAWFRTSDYSLIEVGRPVPDYGRYYCEVNAFQSTTGYVIDSATLIDIEGEGVIVPVDRQDNALGTPVPTGPSPKEVPAFFRIQPDDYLAILSDLERLTDGDYAISLPEGIKLNAAEGGVVNRQYALNVPKILREQGHTTAARYSLRLPILLDNKRIDKRRGHIVPTLEGQRPIAGLSFGALPIYEQGDIWLLVSPPSNVPLNRLSIRLTVNKTVTVHRLTEFDAAGQIMREVRQEQNVLRIRLNDYIPPTCLLQVEVFSGVSRMHSGARLLGLLPPGIHVTSSSIDLYYTPNQRPSVHIKGVTPEQVELASDAQVEEQDELVVVTWTDPQQDAALRLRFGPVILPLTFDVKWSFAWVTPLNGIYLLEDDLNQAILSIHGKPNSKYFISVADGQPREDVLNARGVENISLEVHPLTEMLHLYHGERAAVKLWFAESDQPIDLFTFLRPQFSEFEKQPESVKDAIRAFKTIIRHGRRESGQPLPYSLAVLPREYMDTLPSNLLPPLVKTLLEARTSSNPEASAIFPQRKRRLRLSDSCSYDIDQQGDQAIIKVNRLDSQGQATLTLPLEIETDGLYIRTGNLLLRQCLRCGDLFWSGDKIAKLKHTHGQFGLDTHDLATNPIAGQVEMMPWTLDDLRTFAPRFDSFIDRELEHSLRLRQRGKALDLINQSHESIFTRRAYTQATAAWVLKIGSHPDINSQFASLYKSHTFVDQIAAQFVQGPIPALIFAGRWVITEQAKRKLNDWQMLDPVVMMLAVVARAYAHGYSDILTEIPSHHFSTHLQTAHQCCPQLLTWALIWAELIFLHFSDKADS